MPKFTDLAPPGVLLLAIAALAAQVAHGYEDGAPAGHTGGFGEPDCSFCHSDNEANSAPGRLTLRSDPARGDGEACRLVLVLEHPELESGGFQLAMRTPGGDPAGEPIPLSGRTRVVAKGEQPYLQHSAEGREPQEDGRISWEFEWRPPEEGDVVIHVAANAANDDLSALGDFIFTLEETVELGAGEPATTDEMPPESPCKSAPQETECRASSAPRGTPDGNDRSGRP